jgi:hypothetical protein
MILDMVQFLVKFSSVKVHEILVFLLCLDEQKVYGKGCGCTCKRCMDDDEYIMPEKLY